MYLWCLQGKVKEGKRDTEAQFWMSLFLFFLSLFFFQFCLKSQFSFGVIEVIILAV